MLMGLQLRGSRRDCLVQPVKLKGQLESADEGPDGIVFGLFRLFIRSFSSSFSSFLVILLETGLIAWGERCSSLHLLDIIASICMDCFMSQCFSEIIILLPR